MNGVRTGDTVHRHSDLTVSGLRGGARMIRGTSFDHDTITTAGLPP